MNRAIAILLLLVTCQFCHATTRGKKLIEYGYDVPNTKYLRENISEMEKVPFDGLIFKIDADRAKYPHELGWCAFSRIKFDINDFQRQIDDLKATRFRRFTDRFVQFTVYPGNVDWFDPEWSNIAHNAAILAKIAKMTGCKGIMFDPEPYGTQVWGYTKFPKAWKNAHTFEEYQAKVRERGAEFMREINREFPDITLLCLFGPSSPGLQVVGCRPQDCNLGLAQDFYEGMIDAATPDTVLVDGYEFSYWYRSSAEYAKGRETMLVDTRKLYHNQKAFDKHVRAGFGVWADADWRRIGFGCVDFSRNYFTPKGLQESLFNALNSSDKYVWVYTEKLRWWNQRNAPSAYVKALELARTGAGPGQKVTPKLVEVHADKIKGYSDADTFAEMRKTMTEIFDLPKDGWRFARDEDNTGEKQGWNRPDFDDSKWRTISIGKFWEEQGEKDYDGYAWYRTTFTAPTVETGKRVFLAIGAADESAWIWMNGEYVGKQEKQWNAPFAPDVTDAIKMGDKNSVAIKVHDTILAGGLWKSIKLMAK